MGSVKIYNTEAQEIGFGTISAISTPVTIIIDAPGLSPAGDKLYVTLTTATAGESFKTMKAYSAEPTSTAPSAGNITVVNNVGGANDTVTVEGLATGDVVTVYGSLKPLTKIGESGTAAGSSVTVTLNAPGLSNTNRTIYVTVTSSGVGESPKTPKEYGPEAAAAAPVLSSVTVFNYYETADEVEVSGLSMATPSTFIRRPRTGPVGSVTAGAVSTVKFTLTGALEPAAAGLCLYFKNRHQ